MSKKNNSKQQEFRRFIDYTLIGADVNLVKNFKKFAGNFNNGDILLNHMMQGAPSAFQYVGGIEVNYDMMRKFINSTININLIEQLHQYGSFKNVLHQRLLFKSIGYHYNDASGFISLIDNKHDYDYISNAYGKSYALKTLIDNANNSNNLFFNRPRNEMIAFIVDNDVLNHISNAHVTLNSIQELRNTWPYNDKDYPMFINTLMSSYDNMYCYDVITEVLKTLNGENSTYYANKILAFNIVTNDYDKPLEFIMEQAKIKAYLLNSDTL